ncbi:MAG: lysylphosphatidylglycerol synthase transmembrane domain-containing protein [candidate division WOR-3 bacterium]
MKRSFPTLIRIVISFGLLALLGYLFRNQLSKSINAMLKADPRFLSLAALTYFLFIWISAWRWQVLLFAKGLRFSSWYLARVFTLGLFFCKLLPTSIGGDVMRIAYTTRPGKGPEAFSATFLDRLIGFQSLTFLAIVMALFVAIRRPGALSLGQGKLTGFGVVLLLVLILLLLILLTAVFFSDPCHRLARRLFNSLSRRVGALHRITQLLDRSYEAVKGYRQKPLALGISFLSGIGVQSALSLAWFFTARSVQARVGLGYYFIFIPLLNIVVNIPTIGGLGVREAAFVLFFTPKWLPNQLSPEQALSTALLFLGLDLLFALLGGIFFAFMRRSKETAPAASLQNNLQRDLTIEQKEE